MGAGYCQWGVLTNRKIGNIMSVGPTAEAGGSVAPLGNFCKIAGYQVMLLKTPKDARLAPDGLSILGV